MVTARFQSVRGTVLAAVVVVAVVGCAPESPSTEGPGPSASTSGAPMDDRAVATCEASENDLVTPRLLGAVDATVGEALEIAADAYRADLERDLSGLDAASYAAVCFFADDVPGRTNVVVALESGQSFIANVT